MEKTITTGLMITASMIMVMVLFNVAYPAIVEGGDSIARMASRAEERMNDQITIIHAASELDGDGVWNDGSLPGDFEVFIWAKNVGGSRIAGVASLDLFFGREGNFARVPHQSNAGGAIPYWTAVIEDGTSWDPSTTLKITVHHSAALTSGRYFIKVTTPSGVSDDYFIGL